MNKSQFYIEPWNYNAVQLDAEDIALKHLMFYVAF